MKKLLLMSAAAFLFSHPVLAAVEPGYDPGKPPMSTPWYGWVDEATKAADMRFIEGMRPHHAGALTMSQEYLDNPDASNALLKQLARGIIHNQTFEIGMLDTVEGHLKSVDTKDGERKWAVVATKDLGQVQRFFRAAMPGPLDRGNPEISAEDVRFAKAMIIHHEAALVMAQDYLDDPDARNGYLELMCLDILVDQTREIAYMQSFVDAYPGDADTIKIDPSMVHGMDAMKHMGHGGHHGH